MAGELAKLVGANTAIMQITSPFSETGATVVLNNLYYCPTCNRPFSYEPNAWTTLKQLNVNLLRIGGGSEGDVGHFNMNNYPNEWAQNLNSFLSTADSFGIQVYFNQMGNKYGTLFGIVCPQPPTVIGTSISDSKRMIDALAGNNALGHDFINDPRVFGWSVANEVDLSNSVTYSWVIQILDYIRAEGGKAWVGSPIESTITTNTWTLAGQSDFNQIEPMLRGHVDYLELHTYELNLVTQTINNKQDVYRTMYSFFSKEMQVLMVSEAKNGSIPVDHMIIAEFGITHDVYNDTVRSDYYRAMYQAAKDNGIKIICNFELWDNSNGHGVLNAPYGIIYLNGTYSGPVTVMQQFYQSSAGSTTTTSLGTSTLTTTSTSNTSTLTTFTTTTSSTSLSNTSATTTLTTATSNITQSATTTRNTTTTTQSITTSSSTTTSIVNSTTSSVSSSTSTVSAQALTVLISGQGSVTPNCPNGCSETVGSQVTIAANPSSGWVFSGWSIQSGESCSSNPCTFNMPNNQVTLKATFTQGQVTMTVSYSVVGGGSPTPPVFDYVLKGVSKSLTLTKKAKAVSVDGGSAWSVTPNPLGGSNSAHQWLSTQSTTGIASAMTIQFVFQHQYYLTMVVDGPGSAAPSGEWYNAGQKVTISATPNAGHKFKGWTGTGAGSCTGKSPNHTITMNAAITETATFT